MIISIVNQKGGVGKSSTALALFDGLLKLKKDCLFIDLDSQCNSSYVLDVTRDNLTSYDLFNNSNINNIIIHTNTRGDVIPGNKMLATIDNHLINTANKQYVLKEAIAKLNKYYDYIIIDTPPALNMITINALVCTDTVIIPALADVFSLQGIKSLADTINAVKKVSNSKLSVSGILMTKYNDRTILNRDVLKMANTMADSINTKVFESKIREAVAVKEAQISKQSIYDYAPKSKVTLDYIDFVNELIGERIEL